jgi:hypothetical protein
VDAALAAAHPLEVLHDVGEVDLVAVQARLRHGPVEEGSGWTDERMAGEVLLVAGLLAGHHDSGPARPLAEHRLGPGLPQRAGPALGG